MGAAVDAPAVAEILVNASAIAPPWVVTPSAMSVTNGPSGVLKPRPTTLLFCTEKTSSAVIAGRAVAGRAVQRDGQIELHLVVDILAVERDVARAVGEGPAQIAADLIAFGVEAGADRPFVAAVIAGQREAEIRRERPADRDIAAIAAALGDLELDGAVQLVAAGAADIVDQARDRARPEQVGDAAADEFEPLDAEVVAIIDVIGRGIEAERAEHRNAVIHERRELILAARRQAADEDVARDLAAAGIGLDRRNGVEHVGLAAHAQTGDVVRSRRAHRQRRVEAGAAGAGAGDDDLVIASSLVGARRRASAGGGACPCASAAPGSKVSARADSRNR